MKTKKNTLDEINSSLDIAEEKVNERSYIAIDTN